MVRNGGYSRWFWHEGSDVRSWVYRKYCPRCRVSFSLLPGDALARWQYPCGLVAAWLWAAMRGAPCRSRAFLVEQGVPVPPPDPDISWTEQRDDADLRPSHQLLWRWSRELTVRAARLLPALVGLLIVLGTDLRAVAGSFAGLPPIQAHFAPSSIALAALAVLRRSTAGGAEPAVHDLLFDLVRTLTRRQLPSSHRVVRVSGGRLRYDGLVIRAGP